MPAHPVVRATFDSEGRPTGFYPEPVWSREKAPGSAVEIPYVAYLELLEFQGLRKWDGEKIIPLEAGGRPISVTEMPISEAHRKIAEESQRMHAAIVSVVLAWAGLENALAQLLGAVVPNGLGMALYYTPDATETRIRLVNTAIVYRFQSTKNWMRIEKIWNKLLRKIGSAKTTRNQIVHGNVSTHTSATNKTSVRVTQPIFDFRPSNPDLAMMVRNAEHIRAGGSRTQFPGKSAHDVELAAAKIAELARLAQMFRWPILVCQLPDAEPPSLLQRFLELEADLNLEAHLSADDQSVPSPPFKPPPSPE